LAEKINKNDIVQYVCEECGGVMFEVFQDTKYLFGPENLKTYIKYLNTRSRNGPYYTCQFCEAIHKGYYTNGHLNIDIRPRVTAAK